MESKLRILHLEDSKEDVELIHELLSGAGLDCEIEVVDTGEHFSAALDAKQFDVILSDYSLPAFDGLTALEMAKRKVPDLPFVFVTGTMGEDIAIESLKRGATDYVLKTKLSRLVPAVERAIAEAEERRRLKLAEERLIQAKEEWERTFDAIEDPLMILDGNHRIIKANKALANKLGVAHPVIEGLTCYEHVHGTNGPTEHCPHARLLASGESCSEDIYEDRLGGYYSVSVSPLYDPEGKLYGSVHIARDITERKKAEAALRDSNERFRAFMDFAPFYAYIKDATLNHVFANKKTQDLFLGPRPERLETSDFFAEERAQMLEEIDRRILSGVSECSDIEFHATLAGHEVWLQDIKFPITLSDGTRLLGGMAIDITERKQAEEKLQKWAHVFQCAEWGIMVGSADDMVLDLINPAFARMHGYGVAELAGRPITELLAPESQAEFPDQIRLARRLGHHTFEATHLCKDGSEFPALMDVTVILDDKDSVLYWVVNVQDLTQHKKMEVQLRQAQKMEAIGTLAGGIAHDFNNILTVILGFAEIARQDVSPGSGLARNLDRILAATQRATDLVKQILTFSRQSAAERMPIKIQPLAKESLKMLRASIPSTITIKESIDPQCGAILADPTQVYQVIMNLCTNAFHAMEHSGGVLAIGVEMRAIDSSTPSVGRQLKPGEYVELTVSDTGTGIGPDIIDKIFDPYFTTKGVGKGTGMGLAIAHGIITSYGGTITVESTVGQGTRFRVYFPVVQEEARVVAESQEAPGGKERILFVDDEESIAEMGKDTLERLGYTVSAYSSSAAALAAFAKAPDQFDLVITDMTMPEMTGVELAKQMLIIRLDVPIILCTGFSPQIDTDSLKAIGIKELAMKPFTKSAIGQLVRAVLDGGA